LLAYQEKYFNNAHSPTSTVDALGNTDYRFYDPSGRQTNSVDALGRSNFNLQCPLTPTVREDRCNRNTALPPLCLSERTRSFEALGFRHQFPSKLYGQILPGSPRREADITEKLLSPRAERAAKKALGHCRKAQ